MMALKKISINEYSMLLWRLDCLDYGDEQRVAMERDLKTAYYKYQEILLKLEQVIGAYEAAAAKIRTRHPVNKTSGQAITGK